jgi:hypothetical protein
MNDAIRHTVAALASGALLAACHPSPEPVSERAPVVVTDVPLEARLAQHPDEPVYDPCDGKTCGDPCQLCPPSSDETCVEPPRQCDARGACTNVPPACMAEASR